MFDHGSAPAQYGQGEKVKKDNSAMKYGLGGAAVGALAGGVIAHEMTETSDDEGHHVTQSTTYAAAPPPSDPYATMPVSVSIFCRFYRLILCCSHQLPPRTRTALLSPALTKKRLRNVASRSRRRRRSTTKPWRKGTRADRCWHNG